MSDLDAVIRGARKAREREAREDLHAVIREARDDGATLREIAEAAGMTAERVRQVCRD